METFRILGILNLTVDSFSDGGKYIDPRMAIEKAEQLLSEGADILDLGAQSSNVASLPVSPEDEWARLHPVLAYFREGEGKNRRIPLSIDSFRPAVLEKALEFSVDYWNDITAVQNPQTLEILGSLSREKQPKLIAMFSHNQAERALAESNLHPDTVVDRIIRFFAEKAEIWVRAGIPLENQIFDPGMGFFLGSDPALSTAVLRSLPLLRSRFGQILVSVSRKSFLGNLLGGRPPLGRRIASLAAEIHCIQSGVDLIRTHEPRPIRDFLLVQRAILGDGPGFGSL